MHVRSPAFPIEFALRPVTSARPVEDDATQLVSRSIVPGTTGFPWIAISGLSVPVAAGDKLAIVLRVPTGPSAVDLWELNQSGVYTRGSWFCRNQVSPSGTCRSTWTGFFNTGNPHPFNDVQFRTFVRRAAVAPASAPAMSQGLILIAVGLLLVVGLAGLRGRTTRKYFER